MLIRRLLLAAVACAAFAFAPVAARASCVPLPFVFLDGVSLLTASTTNANNTALRNCATTVDNSQIGAAGIFASQIVPTSGTSAIFGSALGYTFFPNAPAQVPLTISGTTSQTADIFDVTLTTGGTKAVFVASDGTTRFPALTASAPVCIGASNQLTSACSAINFTLLNIGLGFNAGGNASTTVYPYQQVPGYQAGTITKIRVACATADNAATVFHVYDNGTDITGSPYTLSAATTSTFTLGTPFALTAGHILHMVITTAGTGVSCGFTAEGQQQPQ